MQYAKVMDLVKQAQTAGANETTAWIKQMLDECFDDWLDIIEHDQLTEDEKMFVRAAFIEAFAASFD